MIGSLQNTPLPFYDKCLWSAFNPSAKVKLFTELEVTSSENTLLNKKWTTVENYYIIWKFYVTSAY